MAARLMTAGLSRAIATKPPTNKQLVAPLVSASANNNKLHPKQHQLIGPGFCYDKIPAPQTARNKPQRQLGAVLQTKKPELVFPESAPGFHQQRRFLTVGECRRRAASENGAAASYENVLLTRPRKFVAALELNRPRTKNAFSLESADEFVRLFAELEEDSSVRCVLLSGKGADFTSGVDIKSFMGAYAALQSLEDVAHRARLLRRLVERFQAPFKAMHAFGKPIICVQHGLSFGLAMELAACSDIRLCSRDTQMAIREVLIGIAADVGSLQLMPRLAANQSLLSELIFTGRLITPDEALNQLKFVSRVLDTKEQAMETALEMATAIARRSPVAVQGSKRNLRFSGEHSFETGLDYNAVWNAAMMQGGDVVKAVGGIMSKQVEEVDYDDF